MSLTTRTRRITSRRPGPGLFLILVGCFVFFTVGVEFGFHGLGRGRQFSPTTLSKLIRQRWNGHVEEYEITSAAATLVEISPLAPPLQLPQQPLDELCDPPDSSSFPVFTLPRRLAVEPDVASIIRSTCPNNNSSSSSSFQLLLDDLLSRDKKFCNHPLTQSDFICAAQCPEIEPELEHTVRIMRLADHSPEHVIDGCLRKTFPFLVWISNRRIRFLNCMQDFRSDAFMGKEVWKEDMRMLFTLGCIVKLPDPLIFGFDWGDYPAPGFTGAPHDMFKYMVPLPPIVRPVGSDAHHSLLFPTGSFIVATAHCNWRAPNHWWHICIAHADKRDSVAWEARKSVIMWRGAPNGVQWTVNDWRMQQRARLVREFGKEPGFDVAFVQDIHARSEGDQYSYAGEAGVRRVASKNQITENDPEALVTEMIREWVKKEQIVKDEHPNYRHLLHVDGQTASWGLAHKINSGSVVLWIQSARNHREFYYPLLQPWVHFIPIQPDVSDLKPIATWVQQNQAQVKQIARNAAKLADTRMRAQDLYCYVYRLLISIKAAQVKDNIVPNETWLRQRLGDEMFGKFEDIKDWLIWKNAGKPL